MIWVYNVFLTFTSLVWVPWMLARARRRKEPANWKERTGDYAFQLKKGVPRLWLHAVSVGEVMAAQPVLKAVRQLEPDLEIVLSVTTSSGHQTARERLAGLFDHLVYYPVDVYRFVLAAFVRVRPTAVGVMETELWMNFLDAAQHLGSKTILVNGRISDRSFPRARLFRFFYRDLLRRVDRCLMQSETDAERIRALGGRSVEVLGNCKFDQAADAVQADGADWASELGLRADRPVIVVGSTRSESEETFVTAALHGIGAQIVWAPRHLERASPLKTALERAGFMVALRSEGGKMPDSRGVLLLDTYGELSQVYSVADIVVIGGGFDNLGGQNLIQPLALGKPVVHGPHMQNFRDVADAAGRAGASVTIGTPDDLHATLDRLLSQPKVRADMGRAARALVTANQGASARYAEALVRAAHGD